MPYIMVARGIILPFGPPEIPPPLPPMWIVVGGEQPDPVVELEALKRTPDHPRPEILYIPSEPDPDEVLVPAIY